MCAGGCVQCACGCVHTVCAGGCVQCMQVGVYSVYSMCRRVSVA